MSQNHITWADVRAALGRPWNGQSWLLFAAISALGIGLNILAHLDDPREIRQFLGYYLVTASVTVLILTAWWMLRKPTKRSRP